MNYPTVEAPTLQRARPVYFSGSVDGYFKDLEISKKGRPKYLHLQTSTGTDVFKLPKYLGYALQETLQPGMPLRVIGKPQAKKGLKVTNVIPLPHEFGIGRIEGLTLTEAHYSTASTSKIPVCKVQVCSKGTCRKRGSQAILSRLKQELKALNYSNIEVHLETTGCQKACKQGPNIRVKQGRGKARSVNPKRSLAQMLKL